MAVKTEGELLKLIGKCKTSLKDLEKENPAEPKKDSGLAEAEGREITPEEESINIVKELKDLLEGTHSAIERTNKSISDISSAIEAQARLSLVSKEAELKVLDRLSKIKDIAEEDRIERSESYEFVYPVGGGERLIPAGTTIIDIENGEVYLPSGTREKLDNSLKWVEKEWARSLFIDTNKAFTVKLDDKVEHTVGRDDSFFRAGTRCKTVSIEVDESTQLKFWASTNPTATFKEVKKIEIANVAISGDTIKISGETVIAKISGETVSLPATQVVKVSGETIIAKTSGETHIAKISGEVVKISGERIHPITVSGDYVVVSGQVIAKISGEVAKISGETVSLPATQVVKVSGETIIAKTSGETHIAKISGETVIAKVSGEVIKNYGYYPSSSDWRAISVDASGEIRVEATAEVSGQSVKISGETVISKISGEIVSLPVTQNVKISGETVIAKVSGEILSLPSTQVVKISGETITAKTSGETHIAKISGEKIYPITLSGDYVVISGQVISKISGETVIAKTSGETVSLPSSQAVKVSGEMIYVETQSGQAIYTQISGYSIVANVSGEVVKISGETVISKASGETVIAKVSGEKVYAITASGDYISISGDLTADVSGQPVKVSGEVVYVITRSGDYVVISGDLTATADISGQTTYVLTHSGDYVVVSGEVRLPSSQVVKISGETVSLPATQVVKVSGEAIIAKTSGEIVSLPATQKVKMSGEKVYTNTLSGDYVVVSGQVIAEISGETVDIKTPTSVFTGPKQIIGAISGGIVLVSGDVVSVSLKASGKNSGDVYLGGTSLMPYSGYGFCLEPSEAINLDIDNPNRIRAFSTVSGYCSLYVIGVE